MKKLLIGLLFLVFMIQLVSAAEVCVVVDYKGNGPDETDSKCIEIDEGKNGYELLNEMGWSIEWADFGGDLGHALCGINDVGGTSDNCWIGDKYWNFRIAQDGEWRYTDYGFDGNPHYETKDGDFLGLAYGTYGSEPEMFTANISKIYVDGEKQGESKTRRGKIVDVFPESTVKFKIELENLYHHSTDIEIVDISIEGTIEEINDGDDIDEEIKEFDLAADKKTTKNLEFTIPLEVEAKDRLLKIEIKAEDDAGIKYEKEFTYDLEVEKEKHGLKIIKAELNKDSYKCGENALLSFSIINIGAKNENVNLQITNEDLEIDISENFELSNDAFETSSKYEKRFNIWLPNNVSKGSYPVTITANYGAEKEIENVNLVIDECEKKETAETEEAKESEEVTDVETEKISEEKETEAEKEISEKEMRTIEEIIGKNLPVVLTIILGVLFVVIIGLLMIFWVVSR